MRLQVDPMLIIEHFLWQKKSEYAISNHYDRHCVWEEVLQNKRLNKYNHTAIDEQFAFYQSDGLVKFDPFDVRTPLPSCKWYMLFTVEFFVWCCLVIYVYSFCICFVFITLQMFLKVPSLSGHIRQCQIYFHVFGSMKLTGLPHVIN